MAGKRPDWVRPPAHLSENPPVPKPSVPKPEAPGQKSEHGGGRGLEPTRYGDWEKKGICRDF